jgi:hypothetical protein
LTRKGPRGPLIPLLFLAASAAQQSNGDII